MRKRPSRKSMPLRGKTLGTGRSSRGDTTVTFADKAAKAAGCRNPAVAMAALHALATEVKTYEEHHILAGYMEATVMRSLGKGGGKS